MKKVFLLSLVLALCLCGPAWAKNAKDKGPTGVDPKWNALNEQVADLLNEKKYDEAFKILEQSLNYIKENKLLEKKEAALTLGNLGAYYQLTGDYNRADLLYRQSVTVRVKVFGENDPQTALMWKSLSDLHLVQAKYYASQYNRIMKINEDANEGKKKK